LLRFGEDSSVIAIRKGRDARSIPWVSVKGYDDVKVATLVADLHNKYKADAIHVDAGGPGSGVLDILRSWHLPVKEVQFGSSADRAQMNINGFRYANERTEMWGIMREMPTIAIPKDSGSEAASVLGALRLPRQGRRHRPDPQGGDEAPAPGPVT